MTLLLMLLLPVFTSCNALNEEYEQNESVNAVGTMKLVSPLVSVESRSVSVADFEVRILTTDGSVVASYSKYSKMPEIVTLPVGDYQVEAYTANVPNASWNAPYYYGVEPFSIEQNKLTEVTTLICYFEGIKVDVVFDEELVPLLESDVNITIKLGNGELVYGIDEIDKPGYFIAVEEENVMIATLTGTVNGQKVISTQTYTDVKAGEARQIRYTMKKIEDAELYEYGVIVIGGDAFVIDSKCELVELGDITLEVPEDAIQDRPDPSPAPEQNPDDETGDDEKPAQSIKPTLVGSGFDVSEPQYVDDFIESGNPLEIIITSQEGTTLSDIYVIIDSETLTPEELDEVGLASEFSLVHSTEFYQGFADLEFPYGEQITSTNSVTFSITKFLSLLKILGAAEHSFTITATDSNNLSETIELILITE